MEGAFHGRMSTVAEFAGILAEDHGEIPVVNRSMTPVLWLKAKRPAEFAIYSNHPLMKGLIRHAATQFREVETLFGLAEAFDMSLDAVRTLDKIREIIAFSKNRYYFGGMTNWPIYEGILAELHRAMTLMSLLMEHSFHVSTEIAFSLDDPIFDVPNSVFDQSVDLGVSNRLILRISNVQPVPRAQIVSIPVIDPHFCIYDKSGRILPFQLTPDFESPFILSFEVSIPAGSSQFYLLRRCNAYLNAQAKRIPLESSTETRFGNPEFGLILSPDGSFKSVEVGGVRVRFASELGYFIGSDQRVSRAGL